ncbi:hypothetical protein DSO57_1033359 [Entomophthora muscae]|uniref:Uncharacterized protein n=1 Tax=Entomophthora muscae TaxID=34485 RepID=A0ACC2T041_9FUNG|nr:hypothetical protein DSO57_1033359 [Entomophthora muscae]
MLTADALSRLYNKHILCTDGDPDWPMLIMGNLQEGFPPGTPMNIQEKVLKNKYLFKNIYSTLHQTLPNGDTVPVKIDNFSPLKPRPRSGIQTLVLDPYGPLSL